MKNKIKTPTEILAGSRLKIFKETNLLNWQEIADKTGFSFDSVKHWPHDGIDEKKVAGIAKKLGFESWVFTNKKLDDESLKQIFLYPEKQELFAEKFGERKLKIEDTSEKGEVIQDNEHAEDDSTSYQKMQKIQTTIFDKLTKVFTDKSRL